MKSARSALITGGAGFIGSHMADELISDGWKVTVLDNLITGKRENLEHLSGDPSLRFVEGDVSDKDLLKRLLNGTEITVKNNSLSNYPECHNTDPFFYTQAGKVKIMSIREKVRYAPKSWVCLHSCKERRKALSRED